MRAVASLLALTVLACSEPPRAEPVPVEPAPVEPTIVMNEEGERADPATEQAVRRALDDLQHMEPEAPSPEDRAAARDASSVHGRWSIRHTIHRTNGRGAEPSPPLVPTTWELAPDGAFRVRGANAIDARYMYTGDRLIISGFGPVQEYRVDRQTPTELHLTSVIEAGSVRLENTTVLDRAGSP